ncbi:hypothetical protein DESAMIL20_976 [Desulfurella amilsii]|uniref:Uncharacterized protein n=1 Tax=Desulfurella amilsii TaxID=1562698 RepID=A0A1X4XV56_9BACT|nr:hypothetical protein DESAMIL20_976 [Desulfurella amilsii]
MHFLVYFIIPHDIELRRLERQKKRMFTFTITIKPHASIFYKTTMSVYKAGIEEVA